MLDTNLTDIEISLGSIDAHATGGLSTLTDTVNSVGQGMLSGLNIVQDNITMLRESIEDSEWHRNFIPSSPYSKTTQMDYDYDDPITRIAVTTSVVFGVIIAGLLWTLLCTM